jgi:hypothetical protein
MTLSCWIHCAGCGLRLSICRELKPRKRYHTTCRRCGAHIGFGPRNLKWTYEPDLHGFTRVPPPPPIPNWRLSHQITADLHHAPRETSNPSH